MKKLLAYFQGDSLGDLLRHTAITAGILAFIAIVFFYIYLPHSTNHGESIVVPDFTGLPSEKLDSAIQANNLRFEVGDSSYSDEFKPLDVIRQFPHSGSLVKPGRKIFVSINRANPPTVPLPPLDNGDVSLINAIATLQSNELKVGRIFYKASPFKDLVLEMWFNNAKALADTRIAKGTVIDLIVGDGQGPNDMVARSVIGHTLQEAQTLLSEYNMNMGRIIIPTDVDTTGIVVYVIKQKPEPGDSVRVGDPISLWLAPKDYVVKDSLDM
jgi:eukaryotic-like serine/threonine-protein kinase